MHRKLDVHSTGELMAHLHGVAGAVHEQRNQVAGPES
jgi:hypothetical protein